MDTGLLYKHHINNNIDVVLKMREIKKHQSLDANQIKLLQRQQVRNLLRHALTNSNFYKTLYGKNGITINNVDKVSIEDLPIINKNIVMENYDELVCNKSLKKKDLEKFIADPANQNKKYKGIYNVIHTSGSSGTVGIFVYGPNEWNVLKALQIMRVSKTRLNLFPKVKLAFIGADGGHYAGISMVQDMPKLFVEFLPLSINSPLNDILEKVNKYKPNVLSGYSSGIYLLAQEQLKGNINIKPKTAICSADHLSPLMRVKIKEAFKIEPTNLYAASEAIGMGCDCDSSHNLHLFNDLYNFEVVDKNLVPVPNGQTGNLVITNLFNYTQPLIRYKMDDQIVLEEHQCKCGWPFPVMKNILARQEESLCFEKSNGTKENIHALIFIEFFVPGLKKIQVIQVSKNRFVMKAVIDGNKDTILPAIKNEMNEILRGKCLQNDVSFDVEIVPEIKNNENTGKYKMIIPYKETK